MEACSLSQFSIIFILFDRRQYGLEISDMEQPLLIHRPKRKVKDSSSAHLEEVCNTDKLSPDYVCMFM